jgi:NAD(P)-dependent dehydrogenase (short-subunit alcohol dehydrogenase family)
VLNLNLRTAVNTIRAFLPYLGQNGWGRIVTISSGITQAPPPNVAAYVTAKAAVETMTLALAQEVKDRNITANVVLIRALDTPAERAKQPDKKTGWVTPEDVAATLLFLCSEEAGAITGARIPVFGGN